MYILLLAFVSCWCCHPLTQGRKSKKWACFTVNVSGHFIPINAVFRKCMNSSVKWPLWYLLISTCPSTCQVDGTESHTMEQGFATVLGLWMNHPIKWNHDVLLFLRIELRSLGKISEGEELTVAYVDFLNLSEERQRLLKTQYFFDCTCEHCQGHIKDDLKMAGREVDGVKVGVCVPVIDFFRKSNWILWLMTAYKVSFNALRCVKHWMTNHKKWGNSLTWNDWAWHP